MAHGLFYKTSYSALARFGLPVPELWISMHLAKANRRLEHYSAQILSQPDGLHVRHWHQQSIAQR